MMKRKGRLLAGGFALLWLAAGAAGAAEQVLFRDDFGRNKPGKRLPAGYRRFFVTRAPRNEQKTLKFEQSIRAAGKAREFIMVNRDERTAIGIVKNLEVAGGRTCRFTVRTRPEGDLPADFRIMIRAVPSDELAQKVVSPAPEGEKYGESSVEITTAPTDERIVCYLFSPYEGQQAIAVKELTVTEITPDAR